MKQFLIDSAVVRGDSITVSGKDFHYLVRVRRCRPGAALEVMDERGRRFHAEVTEIAENRCVLSLRLSAEAEAAAVNGCLVLLQCLPKAKKMDLIVRQAAEVGLARVVPVVSRHSVSRPERESFSVKTRRWNLIAREAIQQSGSSVATAVEEPVPFADLSGRIADCDGKLFFHQLPCANRTTLHEAAASFSRICFLIGPEGGLAEEELDWLTDGGFRSVYLGKNILRCETAPLYAAAALNVILGECEK